MSVSFGRLLSFRGTSLIVASVCNTENPAIDDSKGNGLGQALATSWHCRSKLRSHAWFAVATLFIVVAAANVSCRTSRSDHARDRIVNSAAAGPSVPDCGLQCVWFVDHHYYRGTRSMRELASVCKLPSRAISLLDIRSALESLGHSAVGFCATADTLHELAPPYILHLNNEGTSVGHFAVVTDSLKDDGGVVAFDPPNSVRRITNGELNRRFSGVGIAIGSSLPSGSPHAIASSHAPTSDIVLIWCCTAIAAALRVRHFRKT